MPTPERVCSIQPCPIWMTAVPASRARAACEIVLKTPTKSGPPVRNRREMSAVRLMAMVRKRPARIGPQRRGPRFGVARYLIQRPPPRPRRRADRLPPAREGLAPDRSLDLRRGCAQPAVELGQGRERLGSRSRISRQGASHVVAREQHAHGGVRRDPRLEVIERDAIGRDGCIKGWHRGNLTGAGNAANDYPISKSFLRNRAR